MPRHSLLLLHWFANVINIDHYNTITVTFNPNTDFGSHHYGNYEGMLDRPPPGSRYFIVGNLHEDTSNQLPDYVQNPPVRQYEGTNRDRIIFSAERLNGVYRISRVYLTHHERGPANDYDPEHTYQISTNLLRQMRQFSNGNPAALWALRNQFHRDISDSQMTNIRATWGDHLTCLGLLLFIVLQGNYNRPLYFTNQSRLTGSTFQSSDYSSSSNGGFGETCANVCRVLLILFLLFVGLIIIAAPKK